MKRIFPFICLLLILSLPVFSSSKIKIEEMGTNSIILDISIDSLKEKILNEGGESFNFIGIDGFGYFAEVGLPKVPSRSISIITSEDPDVKFEILQKEVEVRKGYNLYPVQLPRVAVTGEEENYEFQKNSDFYNLDKFFPENPVDYSRTLTYKGVPLTYLAISPVQYNPKTDELKIYKKLKVKVSFNSVRATRTESLNSKNYSLLRNVAVNANEIPKPRGNIEEDFGADILVITTPQFKPAAESLAVWQRMKGYDVQIDARDNWTAESITTTSHDFYNNTNPKPGYHIIIGDNEHVPAVDYPSLGSQASGHSTDNPYVCTGGDDDFIPEMAHGRISVNNLDEAITIVNKIIKYETNPPTQSSFYNNALGCAYFQDHGEDNMTTYADRAFLQVVERINDYLKDDHNITSERIYSKRDYANPLFYNNKNYSWGEPIPDHLKKENFPWINSPMPYDSDNGYVKILEGFNKGAFLVYHYDHGHMTGWGHPSFHLDNIDDLNNGDLLPVVYSIDCLVGLFDTECFAEKIIRKKDGGAVAIIAASAISWSGQNDALLQGMIDATWPSDKMTLPSPELGKNPEVTKHDPIYTIGDILDQGKFRMQETWLWPSLPEGSQYHNQIYHLFGDPTMEMWTEEPEQLVGSCSDIIATNESGFKVSGLNISDGFATLYNKNSGKVIGKKKVTSGNISIPVKETVGSEGDDVILTIRSHNFKPLIKELKASGETSLKDIKLLNSLSLSFSKNTLQISKSLSENGTLNIFDLKGRLIKTIELKKNQNLINVKFKNNKFTSGIYLVSAKIGEKTVSHKINFNK